MIPKRRLRDFLNRPRRDYRVRKKWNLSKIERLKQRLPVEPPLWGMLRKDQKVCVLTGCRQPRFAFFNDPSTGKTVVSLSVSRYYRKINKVHRVLVLVPNRVNKTEWELEIQKHCPRTSYTILTGSSREKWEMLKRPVLITVETYGGFTRMCCDRNKDGTLRPNRTKARELGKLFQGLVFDESSEVKGHTSLIFRICRKLSKTAFMVFSLTGTPLGRDPTDLWSQMYLVDKGETLGETLGLYRGVFFNSKPGYYGGMEHKFKKSKRRLLHDLLANRSIRYRVRDTDLPKVNRVRKFIRLSDEAKDWFDQATDDLHSARRDPNKIKATFMRMRQMSSGFIGIPGDEEGKRAKIVFDENPKLELLGSIVASIPLDYPVLIVHEFVWSGEQIEKELERLGISSVSLRGSTKDPAKVRREFANGGRLIMNHKAGAFGLNLQNAAYMLFYESPVSSIIRRQTEMRIRRRYSEWSSITQYDLLAMNTMDENILSWHKAGKDLFQAILEGKFSLGDRR